MTTIENYLRDYLPQDKDNWSNDFGLSLLAEAFCGSVICGVGSLSLDSEKCEGLIYFLEGLSLLYGVITLGIGYILIKDYLSANEEKNDFISIRGN